MEENKTNRNTGASNGYGSNTPDIDEETYKFGNRKGGDMKQPSGEDDKSKLKRNEKSEPAKDQDNDQRV